MSKGAVLEGEILAPARIGPPPTKTVTVPDVTSSSGERVVGGKLKRALDDMVWNGKAWQEAAKAAGMTTRGMRKALERLATKNYLKTQRRDFAAAASAQNIHRAIEIRDQDENRIAALHAAKFIENDGAPASDSVNINIQTSVGYVIDLSQPETIAHLEKEP